ncbi:MAG: YggT family protein [Chloroflexi bacterium]|nr:YggT family protein [Chloroflexota bacterium]
MHEDRTDIIETPDGEHEVHQVREVSPRTTEVYNRTVPVNQVTEVTSTTVPRTDVESLDTVAYDPFEGRRLAAYRVTQIIYWVFALIEGLILIRLILKALGANPNAGFAQFIYGITTPLVAPFLGLFGNPAYQNSVLELSSIVALIVYALVAWLLGKLVWILVGETRTAVRTRSTQMDSRV